MSSILSCFLGNYESVVAAFIGAFTAAMMGILASVFIECRGKKREQLKYSKIVSYELNNIVTRINAMDSNIKVGKGAGKLVASNNWIYAKGVLFGILTAAEIGTIDRLYSVAASADDLFESELGMKTFSIDITSFDPQYVRGILFSEQMREVYADIEKIINKLSG